MTLLNKLTAIIPDRSHRSLTPGGDTRTGAGALKNLLPLQDVALLSAFGLLSHEELLRATEEAYRSAVDGVTRAYIEGEVDCDQFREIMGSLISERISHYLQHAVGRLLVS